MKKIFFALLFSTFYVLGGVAEENKSSYLIDKCEKEKNKDACFLLGYSSSFSNNEKIKYLKKACKLGHSLSCGLLAEQYFKQGNNKEGLKFAKKACLMKEKKACGLASYGMLNILKEANGGTLSAEKVKENSSELIHYSKIGCDLSDPYSCFVLANVYILLENYESAYEPVKKCCESKEDFSAKCCEKKRLISQILSEKSESHNGIEYMGNDVYMVRYSGKSTPVSIDNYDASAKAYQLGVGTGFSICNYFEGSNKLYCGKCGTKYNVSSLGEAIYLAGICEIKGKW